LRKKKEKVEKDKKRERERDAFAASGADLSLATASGQSILMRERKGGEQWRKRRGKVFLHSRKKRRTEEKSFESPSQSVPLSYSEGRKEQGV